MRNLIIKREKTAVAAFGTMKVYIEDRVSGDTVIDSMPCRKLGALKNGETATFGITDEPARVYVIADKMSKNFSNDFYQLFYGTEDVYLSGKNKYNPFADNPFWFNNNNNPEAIANRKKSKRKTIVFNLIIFIVCLILGFIAGFMSYEGYTEPKDFSSNGMSITLTDDFIATDIENYTVAYDSAEIAVFALKEEFSLVKGSENYTVSQYLESVKQNASDDTVDIQTESGLKGVEYNFVNPDTLIEYLCV